VGVDVGLHDGIVVLGRIVEVEGCSVGARVGRLVGTTVGAVVGRTELGCRVGL